MAEYTVVVIITNSGNKEISYSLELSGLYEDYPEDYFFVRGNQTHLRKNLEIKTVRHISDTQLKQVIHTWIQDIKQGLNRTTIRLELTSDVIAVENLLNQEEPSIIPKPKPPHQDLRNSTGKERIITEQRSTKNQRDF